MKLKFCAVVIVMLFIIAGVALAAEQNVSGQGPGKGEMMGPGMLGKLASELGLTPTQKAQLKQIHQDFMTQTQATREQLKSKIKEMIALWMVDTPDPAAIKALATEMDGLKITIRDAAIDKMIAAHNVLTPEQRAKFHEIMKDRPLCGWLMDACMGMGMGMHRGGRIGSGPDVPPEQVPAPDPANMCPLGSACPMCPMCR